MGVGRKAEMPAMWRVVALAVGMAGCAGSLPDTAVDAATWCPAGALVNERWRSASDTPAWGWLICGEGDTANGAAAVFEGEPLKLRSLMFLRNGALHGPALGWHPNGSIRSSMLWREGEINGEALWWYESGPLEARGAYRQGRFHGRFEVWDESGKLIRVRCYASGKETDC